MVQRTFVGLLLFFILIYARNSTALSIEAVMKKLDLAEFGAKDTIAKVKMKLIDKDGHTSMRKLIMYQKGSNKRLIQFIEPADVKGLGFLDAGDDKMYVYLPAFHKVRRVAGHVKNENFAGTDFSHDDLGSEKFSERLKPKAMQEDNSHYVLDTIPNSDQYSKIKLWIRKSDFLFDKLEYYDTAGDKWKVFSRKDFRTVGKYVQSYWAEVKDLKKNHVTQLIVESVQCDTGLENRFFSKRRLKRIK